MKKKMMFFIVSIVTVIMFTSCGSSRMIKEGPAGSCGVWYPKKCKIGTKNW
jgi:hypothetical protein